MAFCLPQSAATKFKQAISDGTITPDKLTDMTSDERRSFLTGIVGDDAQEVNALLESKLILKDQQAGIIRWAKSLTGITERARTDIISRVEKMDSILNPGGEAGFLKDLAGKKLGTQVTYDEAQTITKLSQDFKEARDSLSPDSPNGSPERLDYGAKKIALQNYINSIKFNNNPEGISSFVENVKTGNIKGVVHNTLEIGRAAKSLKAVGDLSSLFRQGYKTLFTDPSSWAVNALKTIKDVGKQFTLKGTDNSVRDGILAEVTSRKNAVNGNYDKMNLALGNSEEFIPSSLPERIYIFGRVFKATQVGFEGFLYRMRADVADRLINIAEKNNVDLTKPQLESMGKLTNSLTGRGYLGKYESEGKILNSLFFSPKFIKSNIDTLTAHQFQEGVTPFVRQQAAISTLKVISGTAAILTIAHMLQPKSVDLDSRSSNFGKIKIGNISYDVSGGQAQLVTLAARLMLNSTKSSTTGKVSQLNTGKFGAQTSTGVITDFLTNKEAPIASVVSDLLNRHDFFGNPITVQGEAENAFAPFPIQNIISAAQIEGEPDALLSEIADSLGLYMTVPQKK